MPNPDQHDSTSKDSLDHRIYEWLRDAGYIISSPTEREVLREPSVEDAAKLPEHLRDPGDVIDRIRKMLPDNISHLHGRNPTQRADEHAREEWARAARQGGEISPDIERRMQEDRDEARRARERDDEKS